MFVTGFLRSFESFEIIGIVVLFLFYVVQYTVMFFFNTALVGAAMILKRRLPLEMGSDSIQPVQHHHRLCADCCHSFLPEDNFGKRANSVAIISMIGLAWNIATFLVVPVLAVEKVGPFDAVKRSVALYKKTWGEQIVGNLGLGAFFGLVTFLVILVFVGAAVGLTIWLNPHSLQSLLASPWY